MNDHPGLIDVVAGRVIGVILIGVALFVFTAIPTWIIRKLSSGEHTYRQTWLMVVLCWLMFFLVILGYKITH